MSDVDLDERLQVLFDDFVSGPAPLPDMAAIVGAGKRRRRRMRLEFEITAIALVAVVVLIAAVLVRPSSAVKGPQTVDLAFAPPAQSNLAALRSPVTTTTLGNTVQAAASTFQVGLYRDKMCVNETRLPAVDPYCVGFGLPGKISWGAAPTSDPGAVLVYGTVSSSDVKVVAVGKGDRKRLATIVTDPNVATGVAFYALVPHGDPDPKAQGPSGYAVAYSTEGQQIVESSTATADPAALESQLSPKVGDKVRTRSPISDAPENGPVTEQLLMRSWKLCPSPLTEVRECMDPADQNLAPGGVGVRGTSALDGGAYLLYGVYRGRDVRSIVVGSGAAAGSPLRIATLLRTAEFPDSVLFWALIPSTDPIATNPQAPRPTIRVYNEAGKLVAST